VNPLPLLRFRPEQTDGPLLDLECRTPAFSALYLFGEPLLLHGVRGMVELVCAYYFALRSLSDRLESGLGSTSPCQRAPGLIHNALFSLQLRQECLHRSCGSQRSREFSP